MIFIVFLGLSASALAEKADSVGTKVKNGKVYILHKVEKGQGLYSISKKYGVSLTDLVAENPGSEQVIKIDQIIWVPTTQEVKLQEPVVEDFFDKTEDIDSDEPQELDTEDAVESTYASYHTVVAGETLFSIARKYKTNVDVIKSLNYLQSDVITEGQKILVPGNSGETRASDNFEMDLDAAQEELDLPEVTEIDPIVLDTPDVEGYSIKVIRLEEYNLEKIEESGISNIETTDRNTNKNFAYHCSAPVGTVIMVTNPKNNKTVFVKVIGNFERGASSALVIKLSKLSAASIGLEESGAPVKLSYAR